MIDIKVHPQFVRFRRYCVCQNKSILKGTILGTICWKGFDVPHEGAFPDVRANAAHTASRLTAISVKNAKPGRHADGAGLYVLVKPNGSRSWVFRFMLHGKSRGIGLGPDGPGALSLAGARDEVAALRLKVRASIDPLDERKKAELAAAAAELEEKNARATFRTAAAAYITANFDSWRHDEAGQEGRIAAS